jgi:hypothetical protein
MHQMPSPETDIYDDINIEEVTSSKLRIKLITKLLERGSLTKQQRRTLQTRRNTARFRERERKRELRERLHAIDLPEAENNVGASLNYQLLIKF